MKANLASLEIRHIVKELQFLVGSKVDNIYNPKKEELILQLHIPNRGKQLLRIIAGKMIYLSSIREPAEGPSDFCMLLRKHLDNSRIRSIGQLESERIIEILFEKEEEKKLAIELFGKGNILLCNKENTILSALVYHKWKDREIRAKLKYFYPKMRYNFFNLKLSELKGLFGSSENTIGKCMAVELGLGGTYSDEVCLLSNIDKGMPAKKLNDDGAKRIFDAITPLAGNKTMPFIIYENNEVKDIVPFDLAVYKSLNKKEFKTYNEALDYYFLNELKGEKPKTRHEKEIERLKRVIGQQEDSIGELKAKEEELRKSGDLIYQNYQLINEILAEMKKAVGKHPWKEIEERLRGHKTVKAVNPKDKTIDIEI